MPGAQLEVHWSKPRPRLARGRLVYPIRFHHAKRGEVLIPAGTEVLVQFGRHTLELLEPIEYAGIRVPRHLHTFEKPDPGLLRKMHYSAERRDRSDRRVRNTVAARMAG